MIILTMIVSYITGHYILKDILERIAAVAAYELIAHARNTHVLDSCVDESTVLCSLKIRLLTSLLLSIKQTNTQVAFMLVCTTCCISLLRCYHN